MEKAELRARFRILAKEFFASHEAASLAVIHANIAVALGRYVRENIDAAQLTKALVAVYQPMKVELPAREIVTASGAFDNPQFLFPQVDGKRMWFTDDSGKPAEPNIVIVPGLFVDPSGNRLGRGKGYYDRYLASAPVPLAKRIFLGYAFQFIEAVPVTANDIRVTPLPG